MNDRTAHVVSRGDLTTAGNLVLSAEFAVLFVLLPLAFRFKFIPVPPIPALWLLCGYCLYRLLHDPGFDRTKLWNPAGFRPLAPQILLVFAIAAVGLILAVRYFAPQLLFNFVRERPAFWALVMVLYPILSVYPQGVVYRAFLFQRYQSLFPNTYVLVLVSALAFSFVHIIFRNEIAVGFTLIGGLFFAWHYAESNSLFASAAEHALYGCLMFTIGLGDYFYKGAR